MKNQISCVTATEAARDFSALLDRIAAGEEAIIERHNEAVAFIGPPQSAPRRISECLAIKLPRPSARPDPDFRADLEDIIAQHPAGEPPPWD